ncbi:MAG: hypothetical protein H7Y07_10325 [Pyrinomonadaceae bacterium]|nr:hypothetical protein [Sphingobacteriaceae bacterium]
MTPEEIKEIINKAIKEAIAEAMPPEWLTKEQLCKEFGIKDTTIWKLENDPNDPLIYSSMGSHKHLYHRPDINAFLTKRKRNT